VVPMPPKSGIKFLGASREWERLAPLMGTHNRR
jgi:hypothetical protein